MQKLFYTAIAAFAASLLMPSDPLEAATYTFDAMDVVNNPSNQPSQYLTPSTFPKVSISIQDSTIQSGSFSATYTSSPAAFRGDYASLISFSIGDFITLTPSFGGSITFRANFLFDPDGSVSAGALFYSGDLFKVDLAGSSDLFQGVFVPSNGGYQSFVSGTFTAISEPTSFALLSGGVFALGLLRRRARYNYPFQSSHGGSDCNFERQLRIDDGDVAPDLVQSLTSQALGQGRAGGLVAIGGRDPVLD